MIDYSKLAALAAVLEQGSFEKAAMQLHLTQSAVSQRIKQLEEQFGQALLIRSSPVRPTETGKQLFKHFRQVSLLQHDLIATLSESDRGEYSKLPIGLNADSLSTWFIAAVTPLLKQQQLLLDLKVDDQDQTHKLLKNGEVIGCITAAEKPLQGCNCIPLGVMTYRYLVSAEFYQQHFSDGVTAEKLRGLTSVEFNEKDELQNQYMKQYFGINAGEYLCHRVPSVDAFFELIKAGFGGGMVPDQQSHQARACGEVVELVPDLTIQIPLYWHVWNLKTPAAKALTTQLVNYASKILKQPETVHLQRST